MTINRFKFGVLLIKKDDRSELQSLANNAADSMRFAKFTRFLGDKIVLHGWTRYAGGLDTTGDLTGSHAIYTTHADKQVVFHVAPFISCGGDDEQQIARRRFTGNDIVNVLFLEDGVSSFDLSSIASQFTNCLVVAVMQSESVLSAQVFFKSHVRLGGAKRFRMDSPEDRSRFIRLLIDCEVQCYQAEPFYSQLVRTRTTYLSDMIRSFN